MGRKKVKIEFDPQNVEEIREASEEVISYLRKYYCPPKRIRKGIPEKQAMLMDYWREHIKSYGCPPMITQATRELGYASATSIYQLLRGLEKRGVKLPQLPKQRRNR